MNLIQNHQSIKVLKQLTQTGIIGSVWLTLTTDPSLSSPITFPQTPSHATHWTNNLFLLFFENFDFELVKSRSSTIRLRSANRRLGDPLRGCTNLASRRKKVWTHFYKMPQRRKLRETMKNGKRVEGKWLMIKIDKMKLGEKVKRSKR